MADEDKVSVTSESRADQTGMKDLDSRVAFLNESVSAEYNRLDTEWNDLIQKIAAADSILSRIHNVEVKETDRIKLNVGGKRFEARASNVIKCTYFAALLSLQFTELDSDDFHFIDRNPEWFHVVLHYLREGAIDLSRYDEAQLTAIRRESDFYMVAGLTDDIDRFRTAKKAGDGVTILSINTARGATILFPGLFFEVTIKKDFKLHSISFVAGERAQYTVSCYLKKGGIDSPASPQEIGSITATFERGQVVPIALNGVALSGGGYTIGLYAGVTSGISVCPRKEAVRQFPGVLLGRSYHVNNVRGQLTDRAGEDEYDFSGELAVSFA